ncbi:MAG: [FeFe] hydrogenase H-cluster maturation GTPase HydF, partial [Chlorobi bacterium]|nr:[FeFe] hydrogenase H-cluster maturation GTPase HydF [Chlorobiota bacterium]
SDFSNPMPLLGDLISPGGLTVMIIPIDSEAPKGRIILPQVQAIRDVLDFDACSVVVKETDYPAILDKLKVKPDLVICDSQVVDHMVKYTPEDIPCTTFSILFSRFKGDLVEEVKGAAAIANLKNKDQIIIAESCSHHPNQDDIGRVKIPRWLNNYLKHSPNISHSAGRDYPENINDYKVIIHCGACMLTRNEKLVRIEKAKQASVPITNYGIAISMMQGVLERVLTPFPEALAAFKENIKK